MYLNAFSRQTLACKFSNPLANHWKKAKPSFRKRKNQ
jgi:hypothetical protein